MADIREYWKRLSCKIFDDSTFKKSFKEFANLVAEDSNISNDLKNSVSLLNTIGQIYGVKNQSFQAGFQVLRQHIQTNPRGEKPVIFVHSNGTSLYAKVIGAIVNPHLFTLPNNYGA